MASGTDYDAPCANAVDTLEEVEARHTKTGTASFDIDETEAADGFELPGAELLDDELIVTVIPIQADEFRCDRCFLVRHHSQRHQVDRNLCRDCV